MANILSGDKYRLSNIGYLAVSCTCICRSKKIYSKYRFVINSAYRGATLSANMFTCNRCIQISTKWLLHASSGYILLGAWQIQCHLAFIRERSKCAFPIHKRAFPISTLRIRMPASKHELPTIAAHTVPSSTVNQGGIRVRAIVKVSNKFRRASSSWKESHRVIRKIDFPGMHRMSGPVKI